MRRLILPLTVLACCLSAPAARAQDLAAAIADALANAPALAEAKAQGPGRVVVAQ